MSNSKSTIKLIKSTFYKEKEAKDELISFIEKSDILSMGKMCIAAEEAFSQFQDKKYSIFFNSGSSANLALVQAYLNLGYLTKGDIIGVSSLTWATNVMPLIQLGLKVLPIDVELSTLNISSNTLKNSIDKHGTIKGLFITNALGFSDDIDEIAHLCKNNKILFFEDNCESLGSEYKNKKLGSFGHASTSSFYVGHHLSTIEGGMVSTDDLELNIMLKMVRAHGWDRSLTDSEKKKVEINNSKDFYDSFRFYTTGYNLRPTELNGVLLLQQLKHVNEIISKRQSNFLNYSAKAILNPHIYQYSLENMTTTSNFAFPLIFKTKDLFNKYKQLFEDNNIEIRPIISGNITEHPFFKKFDDRTWDLPNCSKIHNLGFYIPNNPELTSEEVKRITDLIETVL